MKNTLKRAFNIEEPELKPVGLLLAHSFFIGMFVALYFSNANGNFISCFDTSALPYAYIISGIAGFLVSSIFSRLQNKIQYSKLITLVLVFILVLMVVFRLSLLFTSEKEAAFHIFIWFGPALTYSKLTAFVIFIWIAPILGLIALQYWGMALRLFDLRQSKRLFGVIGSGDVISSIIGFFSVPFFVKIFGGTDNLLWLSAIAVGISMIFQFMLIKHFATQLAVKSSRKKKVKSDIGSVFKSPYFKTIFVVTIISIIAQHFVDFTYVGILRKTFLERAQLTSFIGVFFGVIKVVELIAKTVIVGKLLNQYGLKLGLLALASLIGIFTFMAAIAGTVAGIASSLFFLPVAMNKLFDLSGRKSIEEPSFKILYQPLDAETKMIVQTQAEGKAKQIGKMGAGVILLILSSFEFFDELISIYILCGIVVIWLIMSSKLYLEYRNTVKNALDTQKNEADTNNPIFSNELIEQGLKTENINKLNRTISVGDRLDINFSPEILSTLITHSSEEIRVATAPFIQKHIHPTLLPVLQKQLVNEPNPIAHTFWQQSIQSIESLNQLQSEDISRLAKSIKCEDRKKAVLWLQFFEHPEEVSLIRELIGDKEIEIAEMAIRVNQRVKNEMLFLILTELLDNPDYSQELVNTLKSASEVLSIQRLETLFRRHENRPITLLKIVQICGYLNSADSLNFLVQKLNFPNRLVQLTIARILSNAEHKITGIYHRTIVDKLKEEVKFASWLTSSILDLSKDENLAELRAALAVQLDKLDAFMFLLLSLIYDSVAIKRIEESLEKGTKEGVALALEMADILLEDDVKYYMKPILERGTLEEKQKALAEIRPEPKLKIKNRLKNILMKDFSRLTPWIKALAITHLGNISNKLPSEISAYTFHKNNLLKETALVAIHHINPESYDFYSKKESRKDKFTYDKVTGFLKDYPQEISILEEVRLLKALPFFASVSEEILVEIAVLTNEEIILPRQQYASYHYGVEESIHIIIEGKGRLKTAHREVQLEPGIILGLTEKIESENILFETHSTIRVLYLATNQFFELAFIYSELTEAIFEYLSINESKKLKFFREELGLENYAFNDL